MPTDVEVGVKVKTCIKCRTLLASEQFASNKLSRDGLQTYCRRCQATYRPTAVSVSVSEKTCLRCNKTLPAGEFGIHQKSNDGLQKWCRICRAAYAKESKERLVSAISYLESSERVA